MSAPTPLLLLNGRHPHALLEHLQGQSTSEEGFGLPFHLADGPLLDPLWNKVGELWAADGGANALWRASLPAAAIVGDLDSLDPLARRWHEERGARVLERPDQDHNDLEKALDELAKTGHQRCWVAAFEGGRLDMVLGLSTRLAPGRTPELRLAGEEQLVLPLARGSHHFTLEEGAGFSLIAPQECRLSLQGARWSHQDMRLAPGCRGISNRALGGALAILVLEGWVLLTVKAPWGHAPMGEGAR